MLSILLKLGLSEKEAKVYLAALELSEDSVQNIGKKAGVNRATTYVILEKLIDLGLISTYEKDKKTIFIAEDPKELENLLKEEKLELEKREKNLHENLNQLMAVYNRKKGKPIVRFFEGADGLEALDRYGLKDYSKEKEMLSMMPFDLIEEIFPQRRNKSLTERIKTGLKSRVIYTRKDGPLTDKENKNSLREARFVPRNKLPIDATIAIYPNWGIKLYYFSHINPHGVLIQSKELAQNFKQLFELAWVGAKDKK